LDECQYYISHLDKNVVKAYTYSLLSENMYIVNILSTFKTTGIIATITSDKRILTKSITCKPDYKKILNMKIIDVECAYDFVLFYLSIQFKHIRKDYILKTDYITDSNLNLNLDLVSLQVDNGYITEISSFTIKSSSSLLINHYEYLNDEYKFIRYNRINTTTLQCYIITNYKPDPIGFCYIEHISNNNDIDINNNIINNDAWKFLKIVFDTISQNVLEFKKVIKELLWLITMQITNNNNNNTATIMNIKQFNWNKQLATEIYKLISIYYINHPFHINKINSNIISSELGESIYNMFLEIEFLIDSDIELFIKQSLLSYNNNNNNNFINSSYFQEPIQLLSLVHSNYDTWCHEMLWDTTIVNNMQQLSSNNNNVRKLDFLLDNNRINYDIINPINSYRNSDPIDYDIYIMIMIFGMCLIHTLLGQKTSLKYTAMKKKNNMTYNNVIELFKEDIQNYYLDDKNNNNQMEMYSAFLRKLIKNYDHSFDKPINYFYSLYKKLLRLITNIDSNDIQWQNLFNNQIIPFIHYFNDFSSDMFYNLRYTKELWNITTKNAIVIFSYCTILQDTDIIYDFYNLLFTKYGNNLTFDDDINHLHYANYFLNKDFLFKYIHAIPITMNFLLSSGDSEYKKPNITFNKQQILEDHFALNTIQDLLSSNNGFGNDTKLSIMIVKMYKIMLYVSPNSRILNIDFITAAIFLLRCEYYEQTYFDEDIKLLNVNNNNIQNLKHYLRWYRLHHERNLCIFPIKYDIRLSTSLQRKRTNQNNPDHKDDKPILDLYIIKENTPYEQILFPTKDTKDNAYFYPEFKEGRDVVLAYMQSVEVNLNLLKLNHNQLKPDLSLKIKTKDMNDIYIESGLLYKLDTKHIIHQELSEYIDTDIGIVKPNLKNDLYTETNHILTTLKGYIENNSNLYDLISVDKFLFKNKIWQSIIIWYLILNSYII